MEHVHKEEAEDRRTQPACVSDAQQMETECGRERRSARTKPWWTDGGATRGHGVLGLDARTAYVKEWCSQRTLTDRNGRKPVMQVRRGRQTAWCDEVLGEHGRGISARSARRAHTDQQSRIFVSFNCLLLPMRAGGMSQTQP